MCSSIKESHWDNNVSIEGERDMQVKYSRSVWTGVPRNKLDFTII